MPAIWIKQNDTMKEFEVNVKSLLVAQAIMALTCTALALFLLKNKPDFDIMNQDNSGEIDP